MQNKTVEKIQTASDLEYNRGLEAARLRDLSSAITFLNRSLQYNKHNHKARNLLGLICFEIGETHAALRHWNTVISFDNSNEMATAYIKVIIGNQGYVEHINSAVKKYNQALAYVKQGNYDLAIIQLKKVNSLNSHFIRAYELLGLSYILDNQKEKAVKVLRKTLQIDKNNYTVKRYLEAITGGAEEEINDEIVKDSSQGAFSGMNFSLGSSIGQLMALILGVVIGLSVVFFLVMPNKIAEKDSEITDYKTQLATMTTDYNTTKSNYEAEIANMAELEILKTSLEGELDVSEEQLDEVSKVLLALNHYVAGEKVQAADDLFVVNEEDLVGTPALNIYQTSIASIYPEIVLESYETGYDAQRSSDFEKAVGAFEVVTKYIFLADELLPAEEAILEDTYAAEAFYFLGKSYFYTEQYELAQVALEFVEVNYNNSYLIAEGFVGRFLGEIERLN